MNLKMNKLTSTIFSILIISISMHMTLGVNDKNKRDETMDTDLEKDDPLSVFGKREIDSNDLINILIQKEEDLGMTSQKELYENFPGELDEEFEENEDQQKEREFLQGEVMIEKNSEQLQQKYTINTLIELNAEIRDNNKEIIPELELEDFDADLKGFEEQNDKLN